MTTKDMKKMESDLIIWGNDRKDFDSAQSDVVVCHTEWSRSAFNKRAECLI